VLARTTPIIGKSPELLTPSFKVCIEKNICTRQGHVGLGWVVPAYGSLI
jgi:hypothetical protein